MLKTGELGAHVDQEVVQDADPIIGKTQSLQAVQRREGIHIRDVVVVQYQLLQVGEHVQRLHIVYLVVR